MQKPKVVKDAGAYVSTTFSLANLKSRIFRAATACVAYMVGTGQLTAELDWEQFISAFSSPIHVIGMAGVLLAAGSTSGGSK